MTMQHTARRQLPCSVRAIATGLVSLITVSAAPSMAQDVTMETLLDRIQIEDLLTRYYYDLAQGGHVLSEYFTEDALLDVDGTIAVGHEEISALYGGSNDREEPAPPRPQNHMLLTNPVIEVNGNTATAHVIWTGVLNSGVGEPPRIYEQGREDTELVKLEGKWLIKQRYISSDSGLPDRFDETYEPRGNPLSQ